MSVINKMLKDLEQREQKPGADFDSGASAVYQPKKSNNLTLILAIMVVVLIALAAAVSWLLFNSNQTTMPPSTQVQSQVTSPPVKQEQTFEPKTTANTASVQQQVTSSEPVQEATTIETVVETERVTEPAPIPVQPQVEVTEAYLAAERAIAEQGLDDLEEDEIGPDEDDIADQEPVQQQAAQFTIEKTPSHLTREQRLEKLMEKAKSSFDKGYITDAITQLEEVLNSADNHVEARNLLAVAWYGRGELQQAVNILNNGLNRYPNIEMWRLTAAKIFFKENELPGAFSYLEADLPGASAEYYSMKGTLARQLKRFDKAESAYANLTQLEPNKGSWWLGHAIALDSQNKATQAVNSYKQAITQGGISPTSLQFAQQRIESLQE